MKAARTSEAVRWTASGNTTDNTTDHTTGNTTDTTTDSTTDNAHRGEHVLPWKARSKAV